MSYMDKSTLMHLLSEGLSTRAIAEELRVSQTKVRYWLARHKLKPAGKPFITFSDENIEAAVRSSKSFIDVCRNLGASTAGSSHQHFKRRILELKLDTSHFEPWLINRLRDPLKLVLDPTLKRRVKGHRLRAALQNLGRPYQCAECRCSDWQNKPLRLHVDHVDGNWRNNSPENLRYLCLNCHSQTSTWCRQN